MSGVHCYTSVSFSYLDRARVLAETLRRFHPDWTLWLCLSDREPPGFHFDIEKEQFDHLVRIDELGIPALPGWIFTHNVVELCTAVKGRMLCKMFEAGAQKVIYLDPDIAVFESLAHIPELLNQHSIVLTPHLLAPERTTYGVLDNEIGSLKHGVYNLGFIAVRACDEGLQFSRWWSNRLHDHCYEDIPAGIFTDQRWCDLVPAFFSGTHILRDPGYNVACWNLSNRPIEMRRNGEISVLAHPLRFFHFTKVDTVGASVLERYSNGRCEAFELLRWYRERLAIHKPEGLPTGWWAFGHYDDGAPIDRKHRITYRDRLDLRSRFPNPFAGGEDSFQAWYLSHL
jgi:hypothetical protein